MRRRNFLFNLLIVISLFMMAQSALASPNASILYDEENLGDGYWKYDYSFLNNSSSEYLYGVRLEFSGLFEVSSPTLGSTWEGMWGNLSPAIFIETHSIYSCDDIAAGNTISAFSFTTTSQVGNTAYTAFFDDHSGNRSYTTGTTAFGTISNNSDIAVAPEPVSTVLFLTGGATMAFRYRQKRKRPLSQ